MVSGFGSKQPLQQQSTCAYFIGPVCSMVWFCEMFLSVCLVISLFSCLTVNNCIGNMLDCPKILHVARSFLNQSDCRTFQASMFKKQAILNMYLDIIEGLDILGTNESIKCFWLVMVNSGMPLILKCFKMIFQRYGDAFFIWVCIHRSSKLIQFHEMGDFYCSKACLQYFKIIFQSA